MSDSPLNLHASAVVVQGRGLLIKGASGAGKSGLALSMMGLGATLISDDRTILIDDGKGVVLSTPETIAGLIEARGIGLLQAENVAHARLFAVVDLDHNERDRLPQQREFPILGYSVPLLFKVSSPYFPAGLVQFLKGGRRA
ncbi:HPr kinase/phosphorylase [uncultured Pelagimonas sp.]|uniref:HPr kinase/phosphorylase n=1 Tax=uncultured Pelagimonas sp. TaxID=1618102 RepID=UPI002624F13B|nr:HPr kinase/phosphatase C-terminal domain-containing protein [uncultured Pelagimonas sp.]